MNGIGDRTSAPAFGLRQLGAIVAIATLALILRKAIAPYSEAWSWASFGVMLLGGQSLAMAALNGQLRAHPRRVLVWTLLGASAGALLGYWVLGPP